MTHTSYKTSSNTCTRSDFLKKCCYSQTILHLGFTKKVADLKRSSFELSLVGLYSGDQKNFFLLVCSSIISQLDVVTKRPFNQQVTMWKHNFWPTFCHAVLKELSCEQLRMPKRCIKLIALVEIVHRIAIGS